MAASGGPRVTCVYVTWKWAGPGGNAGCIVGSEPQPYDQNNSCGLEATSIHCCAEAAGVLVPEPSVEHALCSSSEPILDRPTPRHSFLFSEPLHCEPCTLPRLLRSSRALDSPWLSCSTGGTQEKTPCPFRALRCSTRLPATGLPLSSIPI